MRAHTYTQAHIYTLTECRVVEGEEGEVAGELRKCVESSRQRIPHYPAPGHVRPYPVMDNLKKKTKKTNNTYITITIFLQSVRHISQYLGHFFPNSSHSFPNQLSAHNNSYFHIQNSLKLQIRARTGECCCSNVLRELFIS